MNPDNRTPEETRMSEARKPVGDGEVVLRLTRDEAQDLLDLAEFNFEETSWGFAPAPCVRTPLGDKLRAALDQGGSDEWREEAWRCYVESGADPDGADARHLNPGEAIRAVRELRADYDAACDEAEWAHAGWNEAEAKLAQLKQSVEEMAEWPCDGEPGPRCPDLGKPEELDHGWCPSCRARAALASLTTEEEAA